MFSSYQNWQNYFHHEQTPPGRGHVLWQSRHRAERPCSCSHLVFPPIIFPHFIVSCHTVWMSLRLLPSPFIKQTEGLFKWLRSTKRDWADGWGRAREDRGRSVREGTKTTPSDCRWLFQSLAWIRPYMEISAGLFSGDTGKAFIEWTMMLK